MFRTPFYHEFLLLLNLFQLVLNLFAVRLFVFHFWQKFTANRYRTSACHYIQIGICKPFAFSTCFFNGLIYCNLFQIFNVNMLFTEMDFIVRYYVCTLYSMPKWSNNKWINEMQHVNIRIDRHEMWCQFALDIRTYITTNV